MNNSLRTHGAITEGSHLEGKGREGKGRGEWLRSIHDLRWLAARLMDDGFACSEVSR